MSLLFDMLFVIDLERRMSDDGLSSYAGRHQQLPEVRRVSMPCCLVAPTVPLSAPESVQVMIHNSTVAEVHWEPVPFSLVRGRLLGYKVCCGSIIKILVFFLFFFCPC